MPAAVAVNGPTPVVEPEVNGNATGTTKQKLTKNQLKRERKKQKKAAEKTQESKEPSVAGEDAEGETEKEGVSLPFSRARPGSEAEDADACSLWEERAFARACWE